MNSTGTYLLYVIITIVVCVFVFSIGYTIYIERTYKNSKKINVENNHPEEETYEDYRKAINRLCDNCEYEDCIHRGKREVLKRQQIDHRYVRCLKEQENYLISVMNKNYHKN